MKIGRYIVLALVAGVVVFFGVRACRNHKTPAQRVASVSGSAISLPAYDDSAYNTRAPDSVRITVEVVNATGKRGLARRATMYLRDRGFDVVSIGSTKDRHDTTLVLDRMGHPQRAALVAKAMSGRVETRPDTSRYIDVTVLIGHNWTPPAEPFYP